MRTVNTSIKKVEFKQLTKEQFIDLITLKRLSLGLMDTNDKRPNITEPYLSALKRAGQKGKFAISTHFWQDDKVSGFAVYDSKKKEYFVRTETKVVHPVEVSDEVYQECLDDIKDQKETDRFYNWIPKSNDYYNIENWVFNIKDGKLLR